MLIKCRDWVAEEYISLGIQTNPPLIMQSVHDKAKHFAPKRAKSYTILAVNNTDYHGIKSDTCTGYASAQVAYFTTKNEGANLL